jgi:hypothetical protein
MSIENTNANAIPISLSKIIFQTFLQLQEVSGEAAAVKKKDSANIQQIYRVPTTSH